MAKEILAYEIEEGLFFNDNEGTVLGYLEPFSGQPLEGDIIFRLVTHEEMEARNAQPS